MGTIIFTERLIKLRFISKIYLQLHLKYTITNKPRSNRPLNIKSRVRERMNTKWYQFKPANIETHACSRGRLSVRLPSTSSPYLR